MPSDPSRLPNLGALIVRPLTIRALPIAALTIGAALAAIAFEATAQNETPDEVIEVDASDIPPSAEPGCFEVRSVRNFDAITDRFVYVEGRGDRHYLLTMVGICPGLRGSLGIRIASNLSRVCTNSRGRITYRGIGRAETCTIGDVDVVASRQAAERLVGVRTE